MDFLRTWRVFGRPLLGTCILGHVVDDEHPKLKHNFSLLPVIGILINLYLMSELGASNWIIFVIWLAVGLLIYFLYGYKHSKLRKEA